MACFRPIEAYRPDEGGSIVFYDRKGYRQIAIPCGQCIGCRIAKRDAWAIRCFAESKMHPVNSFVTLTYDEEHYPQHGSLDYRHFQLFMKRLRKKFGAVRFFMCGEYGELLDRPHYHALLFGLEFPDAVKSNSLYSDHDLFSSEILSGLWGRGMCSIGHVTYASARYCAVYATKKITGQRALEHYSRVDVATGEVVQVKPEFARMSLKPGVGYSWLERYWRDVYLSGQDGVVVDGVRKKAPRYFDSKLDDFARLLMDDVEYQRFLQVDPANSTRDRLEVREAVAHARERFNNERRSS